ncbi:MAG: imidazole glycerol phosphate synthase subunit HisH [Chloroflexota bacterium]
MIAVIDSGVANLRSVAHALIYLGVEMKIATTPDDLEHADKIILPGVGAYSAGMAQLQNRCFVEPLHDYAARGIPILGICLGMQLLFERSYEMGDYQGLGLLHGEIVRFAPHGPKVPHMGWNQLDHDESSPLLKSVPTGSYAYFVHSYYAKPASNDMVLATTDYGIGFPSVVGQGNIFGAQFHPEKSQRAGLTLLKNFVEL